MPTETGLSGYALLRNAHLNNGTSFTQAERRPIASKACCRRGSARSSCKSAAPTPNWIISTTTCRNICSCPTCRRATKRCSIAVLMSDPAKFMPLVYTPTVGEACQKFDHIFHAARGLYLPITARGRLEGAAGQLAARRTCGSSSSPTASASWAWAIWASAAWAFPIGKLALYTACAGVPPQSMPADHARRRHEQPAPARRSALSRPAAEPRARRGIRRLHRRVRRTPCRRLYPKCCMQWEDFANFNAVPILERYRDKICTYNDDIQGTAAVALAGIFGALRISRQKLTDQRFLFLGAGSAGTGIAELISQAMAMEGLSIAEARAPQCPVRRQRADRQVAHRPGRFPKAVRPGCHAPIATFVEAIKQLKPTGIIGVSTVPKLFNQQVIEAMAEINERPIIFPYSNPTSRSECTAEEAYRWSDGRAIFASGSPFPPVQIDGRTFVPGQGNNVYVFPGDGHGGVRHRGHARDRRDVHRRRQGHRRAGHAGKPRHRPDLSAAEQDSSRPRCTSPAAWPQYIFDKNLARVPARDIAAFIRSRAYQPVYTPVA